MIKRMTLLALSALLLASSPVRAQAPQVKPAAIVNGEPIPMSEVQGLLKQQPPPANPPTAAQKKEMEQVATDMLVNDLLMRQFLRKNAAQPAAADIEKEIAELAKALAKDKMTVAEFLRDSGQTEQNLRQDIASKLQWKSYILPRLPDTVVKTYFDANKVFFDKVFVRASHILVKVPENATQDDRQKAFNRINAVKQELAGGKKDFATLAKEYSDCPSKKNNGDLGPFPYKFVVVEPFAKAAFAMKVNDVSDVVTTEFGYHLIKVTDRTAGTPANFEAIKEQVREIYAQEVYQSILAEQRKVAKIEP